MKKMKYLKSIIIIFLSSLMSCEKVFVIKTEDAENYMVVNAIFNDKEPFEAEVTKSFSPYGDFTVIELKNLPAITWLHLESSNE